MTSQYFVHHSASLGLLFALVAFVAQIPFLLGPMFAPIAGLDLTFFFFAWAGIVSGIYGRLTRKIIVAFLVGIGSYVPGTLIGLILNFSPPLYYLTIGVGAGLIGAGSAAFTRKKVIGMIGVVLGVVCWMFVFTASSSGFR